jgi:hypothetical protein
MGMRGDFIALRAGLLYPAIGIVSPTRAASERDSSPAIVIGRWPLRVRFGTWVDGDVPAPWENHSAGGV